MKSEDLEVWQGISIRTTLKELVFSYENPSSFQKELATYIEMLFRDNLHPASIEVGSSFGVTSALLPAKFNKTILDFDVEALRKARELYEFIGQKVNVFYMDMFNLDKIDSKYELVFNAGVLEHFDFAERIKVISNMVHITKVGGYIIIAIPNHLSLPYRTGYLYCNLFGKWMYPAEFKIDNLEDELRTIEGIEQVAKFSLDKENIYNYLPLFLRVSFKILDKWFKWEGYLKVIVFKKLGVK
ncbi:MAG: class I SAM-dependent methyltransferase [Firmicutes bacterium]|nr:class I SAM-dependent methyltransferase [Bacillota bacterium]